MHIGLIGGIGPAATDVYYRALIAHAARAGRDLQLTIVHADMTTLLENLRSDNQAAQCTIYAHLTERLCKAGADCVAVSSIAGHFCIDRFAAMTPVPLIDLTRAVAGRLKREGLRRVGILGTETVMASGMYGKLAPVAVEAPPAAERMRVHEAYVSLAQSGQSTPALQAIFFKAGQDMVQRGAEAVLLGGTDLNAAFDGASCGFPVVDCARVHVEAIAGYI